MHLPIPIILILFLMATAPTPPPPPPPAAIGIWSHPLISAPKAAAATTATPAVTQQAAQFVTSIMAQTYVAALL